MKLKYFKFERRTFINALILVFTLGLLSNCATEPKERKLEVEGFTLMYKAQKSANSEVKNISIDHPVKISVEAMTAQLLSLKYKELALFGKNKAIFSVKDINSIARLMAKALARSPSDKLVYFELEAAGGLTKGQLFHSKKMLHWRFSKISGRNFNLSNRGASGFRGKGTIWKMIPQRGQALKKTKGIFSVTWDNWLVSKLKLPMTKGLQKRKKTYIKEKLKEPKPSQAPSRPSSDSVVEEKLKTLNDLKRKGLINENEYQKRKQAILDRYL
jgi:hypothetical protein